MSDIKVSICCLAYNHEPYIRQCLDGFVMQKCNFKFEVLIHDDASTDKTAAIIREYEAQYPDIIKPICQIENQHSKGVKPTFSYNFPRAQGKYVSFCEGDDYWTDPNKLQKQFDFLEQNEDYVMCAHVVEEKNEIANTSHFFPNTEKNITLNIEDYILNNHTGTCSLLFESKYFKPVPEWFLKVSLGDIALVLTVLHRSKKKLMVLKDAMGVYRVNEGGVHGSLKKNNKSLIKAYKMHIDFINAVNNKLFHKKEYSKEVKLKLILTYKKLSDLSRTESKKQFTYFYLKHLWFRVLLKMEKIIKK